MADRKPTPFTADMLRQDLPHVVAFLRVFTRSLPDQLGDDTPDELEKILASDLGLTLLAEKFNQPK